MPPAWERGGGPVSHPVAEAGILALKKACASTDAEGLADAFSNPISKVRADAKVLPDPKIIADPEVFPDPEILSNPQTHSGAET